MSTMADLVRARADDRSIGLLFEDEAYRYDELVQAAAERAAFLLEHHDAPGQPHVGVLLANVPEYLHWLSAVALAGGVLVGINPTRRGTELAADIRHTDCQWIITDSTQLSLLEGIDTGVPDSRVILTDSPAWQARLAVHAGAGLPDVVPGEDDLFLLVFTSGTSGGATKACRCTQGRLARLGTYMRSRTELEADDVCYQVMPLFHSNALMACWAPALVAGASIAMRRRFSASNWLPDVRRFGATYFNYVGRPLAYILSTPERSDDRENPLRLAYGSEGNTQDVHQFAERFDCHVVDSYGSTEGVIAIPSPPDGPAGCLGRLPDGVQLLDPDTGAPVAVARFDEAGRLTNAGEAIGELVGPVGTNGFEGYYKNADADAAQVRDGLYWSGDLAYTDADGFVYFAGRSYDRIRVDGENFASAPIEQIINRHPDIVLATVYAVPDERVGDQVMACVQLRDGMEFSPEEFDRHLSEQPDLGTKWSPRFVRVTRSMPMTQSNKVIKRQLRADRWECSDPVWWRPERGMPLGRMDPGDIARIRESFAAVGNVAALDAS